jgi:tripartite-type tricarboxylate transporter receptor subunit TctC
MSLFKRYLGLLALIFVALPLQQAFAQAYPNKPIRLVVPFPPGGATDVVARIIGQKWSEAFGQPVVVDNKAGASGAIAHELVARAPADGYTLIVGTASTQAANPVVNKVTWDPVKDFTSVALVASEPMALVVHPSVPANSVAELIALAKAKPGALNMASFGTGTVSHLAGELFNSMAGTKMTHVPYKGAGPAMTDLMGGQVQVMFNTMSVVFSAAKAGKLRMLAVGSATRNSQLPDVPTISEAGVPGYDAGTWQGISGPANLPKDIVARLSSEVSKALKVPEVAEKFISLGSEPQGGTPGELDAVVKADLAKWGRIVKEANIKGE